MMLGANKTGKTRAGINEVLYWFFGKHPYRKVPSPCFIWMVSQDYAQNEDAISGYEGADESFSELTRWLAAYPDRDVKINRYKRTILNKRTGSIIKSKSCESGEDKFMSAKLHLIHFDEEPYRKIFEECLFRLVDYKGSWIMTATPTDGTASWTHPYFWEKRGDPYPNFMNARGNPAGYYNRDTKIALFNPSVYDNKDPLTGKLNLSNSEIRQLENSSLSNATKRIRLYGEYATFEGLVFGDVWDPSKQIITPFPIPDDWRRFRGIDFGFSPGHPFVCEWIAESPDGDFFVYDEYKASGRTIQENALAIKKKTAEQKIFATVADPKGGDRRVELFVAGIPHIAGDANVEGRVDCIQELLGTGRLFIFRDKAPPLVDNLNSWSWKKQSDRTATVPNKPVASNNDGIDAIGYVLLKFKRFGAPDRQVEEKPMTPYEVEKSNIWGKIEKEFQEKTPDEQSRQALILEEYDYVQEDLCY